LLMLRYGFYECKDYLIIRGMCMYLKQKFQEIIIPFFSNQVKTMLWL